MPLILLTMPPRWLPLYADYMTDATPDASCQSPASRLMPDRYISLDIAASARLPLGLEFQLISILRPDCTRRYSGRELGFADRLSACFILCDAHIRREIIPPLRRCSLTLIRATREVEAISF